MNRPLVEPIAIAPLVGCAPVARPVEGHPIGNGRMGTLVWTTPGTIEFQINRVDVFAVNRHTAHPHYANPDTATTDTCGGCGRVSISAGGEPFRAGPAFEQHLSLAAARCTVSGEGVQAECWVAAGTEGVTSLIFDLDAGGRGGYKPGGWCGVVWRFSWNALGGMTSWLGPCVWSLLGHTTTSRLAG